VLSLILTCLLSGPDPLPLFEQTPPAPVEVVGRIKLGDRDYKITNYTDMRVDDRTIARPRDVPQGATATRIDVSEAGYVLFLWFSTEKDK